MEAKVEAVCISEKKGTKKKEVPFVKVQKDFGIIKDAHAGNWHRQISLLPLESADKVREIIPSLKPGDFAENILTSGITLNDLPVGTILRIGDVHLKITQIGKECHNDCEIKRLTGRCVMPTDGVFAVALDDGIIRKGMDIEIEAD